MRGRAVLSTVVSVCQIGCEGDLASPRSGVPVNRTWRISFPTALALVFAVPLFGQEAEPLITDRPTFSAAPFTVAPGRFQFEMGYTFTKSGDEEQHDFGEFTARIGILPWLEGRLGLNSFVLLQTPDDELSGLQDLTVGAKAIIFRRPEGSSAAVPQVSLATEQVGSA